MILERYNSLGGIHPETAVIKNVLAYHGVANPQSGKPISEPLLLGIGGGLGSCYILWEFKKHGTPSLVLAFQNKSNYPVKFLQGLCSRMNAETELFETGGKKKAAAQLEQNLAEGNPAIAWMDLGGKPYYVHFLNIGVATVYGIDGNNMLVDNLASKPYLIPSELLAEARAKVPSFKNRLMVVKPKGAFDLEMAIQEGIVDCIDYLSASSTSFSLPAIRKWARTMTDKKNKKGWPTVFKGGMGLYGSLRTIYEAVELIGTGGGGLRGMYADFLDEAALIFNSDGLTATARYYRSLHEQWRALAQTALPDHIKEFKSTKEMLDQRYAIFEKEGSDGLAEAAPISDALHELKKELNFNFPMSERETQSLFAELQSQLEGIYQAEKDALSSLREAAAQIGA